MSFIEDLIGSITFQTQVDAACKIAVVAELGPTDANITDVEDNWKPTGFYSPDQMRQIVAFGLALIDQGLTADLAAQKQAQLDVHRSLLDYAHDQLTDSLLSPDKFINAIHQADLTSDATGKQAVIESQGLKRWVLDVLKAARQAKMAVKVVDCARPGMLLSILSALGQAADALISFIKTVVGIAKNVVATIGAILIKIPDVLGTFLTVLKWTPWIALAFGGYYAGVKTGVIPTRFDPLELRHRQTFKPWRRIGS